MVRSRRLLRNFALLACFPFCAALFAACATSGPALPEGGGTNGTGNPVCFLQDCNADIECGTCTEGRTRCQVNEHRCVACDTDNQTGCAEGEVCSRYGTCVADGATCPLDEGNIPTITCISSKDCLACDPNHQACDTSSSRCVTCTAEDTSACHPGDTCIDGQCQAGCPAQCTVDSDCGQCSTPDYDAHACNAGTCSECSPTLPCSQGLSCSAEGRCVSCDHDVCVTGGALGPTCSTCTQAICDADSYCCNTAWDATCVSEVAMYCGTACSCTHSECSAGGPLANGCSSCVTDVCALDPFCCTNDWDAQCVTGANTACGVSCGVGCAHSECALGGPLANGCSSCVSTICAVDPYCCSVGWDAQCFSEVNTLCGVSCGGT